MILCDFHIHSTHSDGRLTIPQIVDLYGSQGFGAIAITDHLCEADTLLGRAARLIGNTLTPGGYSGYLEEINAEAERARELYKMVVIPGFELTKNHVLNARSAHVLALGVREWIYADQDAVTLAREIRAKGGLAVAAHPVPTRKFEKQTLYLWDRREELAGEFDAWEVAAGRILFDEVLHSGLPILANSDMHHPKQIRSWKTLLHCEKHPEAILDAIRRQEVEFRFHEPAGIPSWAEETA